MVIRLNANAPDSWFCSDDYLFTTLKSVSPQHFFFRGSKSISYQLADQGERDFYRQKGIAMIQMCDSILNIIPDLLLSAEIFTTEILEALHFEITPKLR